MRVQDGGCRIGDRHCIAATSGILVSPCRSNERKCRLYNRTLFVGQTSGMWDVRYHVIWVDAENDLLSYMITYFSDYALMCRVSTVCRHA
ncbi:hypothetical protein QKG27_gp047 [Gallid alphaherpesvirus 3]|uniref:Uncharacterized protein ORF205 n=1 Tax=Gallid alphaherpesvirus 3 TaxID=35250 RepID=F8TC22_9ALPH|nr:hypothetical protein QKG27_gp047 [Gallid alphaherpesvirus 3]AEI00233.1 hypothetical protein [Gallid alphaherpesvirus 3]QEY02316.1 hypothetical protein [Gallid alphaherpesvirus 3]